ncbi:hypothetical protein RM530_15535 [Algiphilus sp. W345]|uniref:Uncharacterized protein n=1 Tax=Banduia mediterranea TaxID=3075609 RepID=A0ABU2WLN3_9GAMM|nr:hypothetical protein [Algiphilus sp. W345]MDT0498761.1 hypothetical protein [Algiphilus sp. W345]
MQPRFPGAFQQPVLDRRLQSVTPGETPRKVQMPFADASHVHTDIAMTRRQFERDRQRMRNLVKLGVVDEGDVHRSCQ